jgi:dolichyl-phosphate-mannose--protein O-mannosyl transferase
MQIIFVGVITLYSFLLRIINLGRPNSLVFDEIYYVDGARDLLKYGVEVDGLKPEFIVHPPVGKWLIGAGIQFFGNDSFGWRFMSALVGTLMIVLIALIAHELFHSQVLTILASALMSLDGLALVHSRTALLDNFLAFFILLAAYFFIKEWHWFTGLFLGLALGTKWSALYFIAVFGLISIYKVFTSGSGKRLLKPSAIVAAQYGLLPLAIYVTSWFGWFKSNRGWDRDWSSNPITSFIYYHKQMLGFHTGLTDKHSYQANAWSWLVMGRPTSFFYESPKGCGADACAQEVLALGTPLLWWSATIALCVVVAIWAKSLFERRIDPALTLIMSGLVAGYLPWFFFQKRTVFSFYAIVFEPFLILALTYCAWLWFEKAKNSRVAMSLMAALLIVIALNFIYFMPLYTADVITYDAWRQHMWLPSWI